ncbi:MMPL family transporter [Actinokineospora fastidiosa]|nr:MMPL family transporter [Actinokineospora fastidiosa]
MERLSRFVLRRARAVGLVIAAAVLTGGAALALLLPRVTEANEFPGLPGYEANQRITAEFGTGGEARPVVPVVELSGPADLTAAFAAVSAMGARVAYEEPVFAEGNTRYALVYGGPVQAGGLPGSALGEGTDLAERVRAAMAPHLPSDARLHVTGLDELATGIDGGGVDMAVKLSVTIAAALVVLIRAFRSRLALVPLLTAAVAVPVSFLGLLAASLVVDIHDTTMMMAPLFGVGLAVDYGLLVVSRWREERASGASPLDAVHTAMATAGHAVGFSAAVVAVGLVTMVVLPIPLLRSLGVGGMLVTAASAAVSLTLLPLVLARAGAVKAERRSARWPRWAALIVRHKVAALSVSGALLLGLSAIALTINLHVPRSADLADSGPGREGLTALTDAGVPSGVLTSFDVYVPDAGAVPALVRTLESVPGVHAVVSPDSWRSGDAALLGVLPAAEGEPGLATLDRVREVVPDGVLVGGNITQQEDFLDAAYDAFPWMLAILSVATFLLLARAFRSLVLPLKAILLNLLSLGAVLGATVVLWQWGWGTETLLGIQPDGAVGTFVPITVFAFLFGLSMDYEVFLVSRMREEYDHTGSTREAVVNGLGSTGRLITRAALILFCSFAAMSLGGELDVAVFSSAVAIGILLDATLIRAILVPAAVAVMDRWNWWWPGYSRRRPSRQAKDSVSDSTAARPFSAEPSDGRPITPDSV